MNDTAVPPASSRPKASMRLVVAASAAGTAFEWYDFFVFGALTPTIAKNFFSALDSTAGLIAALALFGAGFFFRPLGALIFGRVGDRLGRKGAFLVTVSLMGGATVAIGLLPTWPQAGPIAPILLILMRILQGLALGGEFGGAIIYVAEHAKTERRGLSTGWVQAAAAYGLIGALLAIWLTRGAVGETAFVSAGWTGGWRLPFLLSAGLLAISVVMRLRLSESPAFAAMRETEGATRAPWSEAFGRWANLKWVLVALVTIMSAQGAAWYTLFFYAEQVFLERFMKLPPQIGTGLLIAISAASAPLYIFFAWVSDKVGRRPVAWGGMTLALISYFPAFHALAHFANPALAEARARAPVVVVADPARCSVQFDLTGKARYTTSCDLARGALTESGVSYRMEAATPGTLAKVRIGRAVIASREASGLPAAAQKATARTVKADLAAALGEAGYPRAADPKRINILGLFGVLMIFVIACTALFAPISATLVELFPTRIRYTALSLPYHVGTGWVGGFLPVSAFAIVTVTGDIYAGLWYPLLFTAISVISLPLLLPETRGRPLNRSTS